jgi:hypothetical protein
MPLPITIPNTFANATATIPLSQLDNNFSTVAVAVNSIGNGAFSLANVQINGGTIANVTLDNVSVDVETLSNVTITNLTVNGNATLTNATVTANVATITTANVTTANVTNMVTGNATITGGTINVSSVIATDDVTVGDDLVFTGTGNRITGDFSNATIANRVMFQTSTVNGNTIINGIPNGTSVISRWRAFNAADPTNASFADFGASGTATIIQSGIEGTGSYLPMTFFTGGSERMRVDTTGRLGLGTTSPEAKLDVRGSSTFLVNATNPTAWISVDSALTTGSMYNQWNTTSNLGISGTYTNHPYVFVTNNTERARITSGGDLLVGRTDTSGLGTAGCVLYGGGELWVTRNAASPVAINRLTDDGTLIGFYQATSLEGSISVSGATVSYNAFAGSHWSQLQDGSKPEILRGTVMESIDELVQWPDEPTTERLCRSKVSDTAGSKRVYGVFMDWDNDWTATNDMLVTSLGAFICRVNAGVTVQMGDLLESNGDGTARVQADDIIRSSTIGKVTGTTKTHEYDDGSYCVPTVLYCG